MSLTSANTSKTAFPILDMMLQMQRIGLQAMSLYQPVASTFLDAPASSKRAPAGRFAGDAKAEEVVAIGEEVLNVGTRTVPGKTTRIRRVVVEAPVEKEVTLHTETVVVERRQPHTSIGQDVLTEVTVEMSEFKRGPGGLEVRPPCRGSFVAQGSHRADRDDPRHGEAR